MPDLASKLLLESLRWLQKSEEYSDLKIFCGDEVFKAHKAIVCSQSKYFQKSCNWANSEDSKKEIILEDDDPRIIRLMLDYLYRLDYNDLLPEETPAEKVEALPEPESPVSKTVKFFETFRDGGDPDLAQTISSDGGTQSNLVPDNIAQNSQLEAAVDDLHLIYGSTSKKGKKYKKKKSKDTRPRSRSSVEDLARNRLTVNTIMYALADKYAIDGLKALARQKFEAAVETDLDSKEFAHAAELAFETTPDSDKGLRSVVIKTLNNHRELVENEEIQNLLQSGNGMAWGFVQVLLENRQGWYWEKQL